jgi:hypothetical protein
MVCAVINFLYLNEEKCIVIKILYNYSVAATKSPVIFIGTGEHTDDFEPFKVQPCGSNTVIIQNFYYNTFLFIQIQKVNYSTNNSTQLVTLLHLWFYTVL